MLKTLGSYLALIFWLAFGIYFGLAGIIYYDFSNEKEVVTTKVVKDENSGDEPTVYYVDEIPFSSLERAQAYIEENRIGSMYNWFYRIPDKLTLFLTSMALGGLGSVISIVSRMALKNASIVDLKVFWNALLGALIGILVLGISYILPLLLTTETEINIRPTTLIFISLFAGLYAEKFLTSLEKYFSQKITHHEQNT